jgi:starch phosphorylase
MEASGTGNMKLSLNGALTVGTLDGANVEIREAVGPEHFFLFGWTADQVEQSMTDGYVPRAIYESNEELQEVIDLISSGYFSPDNRGLFRPLTDALLAFDPFRVLADFASYVECQRRVEQAYLDPARWDRSCVINIAKMGRFSSDRTIREYASEIWNVDPVQVKVPRYVSTDPTS